MLTNYLKIAWRNFLLHWGFSLINVAGFAIGLLCCVFIFLFIENEARYDRHFERAGDIYRVMTKMSGTQIGTISLSSPPLADAMRSDFEEVEQAARLLKLPGVAQHLIKILEGGQLKSSFFESEGFLVDPTFFEVFAYPFVYGNPAEALRQPFSVVLSEELATKYFGNQNPFGRPLRIENAWGVYDCTVTGVFRNNLRSHIPAQFFMAMNSGEAGQFVLQNQDWAGSNLFYTYLKLRPGSDPAALTGKFPDFLKKHASAPLTVAGISKTLALERLTDIHLNIAGTDSPKDDLSPRGDWRRLWALGSVGLFILLIACINYMNLSTARFARRNREVGVRKVLGAQRGLLIRQFLAESVMVSLVAGFVAVALVMPLLPVFENFTGKVIETASIQTALGGSLAIALLAGLLAGSYPALYLSSFRPADALKNLTRNASLTSAVHLRKALVVLQFAISAALIIGTLVVWQQMRFLRQTNLGFDKDQKVILPLKTTEAEEHYRKLKAAISRLLQVKGVSACTAYPGIASFADLDIIPAGKTMNESRSINVNYVDEGFVQMMGIALKHGRYATNEFASDTAGFGGWMLNEAAVAALGLTPETAVGHKFRTFWRNQEREFEVVGVLKDFHFESLHKKINPQGFRITSVEQTGYGYLVADVQAGDWSKTLAALAGAWSSVVPGIPFESHFLDEAFQKNYQEEARAFTMISLFASLAIFISCLGLFGLAAYAVERRRKEIAIRKVVGASAVSLAGLLSKEFLKPVILALAIASPPAYYFMNKWLENFSYRIDIEWTVFAITGAAAMAVALLTVGFQSVRAAVANPVKSLRSE